MKIWQITFTYSPTQEILDYPLEYASVPHIQKFYLSISQVAKETITWNFYSSI